MSIVDSETTNGCVICTSGRNALNIYHISFTENSAASLPLRGTVVWELTGHSAVWLFTCSLEMLLLTYLMIVNKYAVRCRQSAGMKLMMQTVSLKINC